MEGRDQVPKKDPVPIKKQTGPLFARLATPTNHETDPINQRSKSAQPGYGGTTVSSPLAEGPFRSFDLSTPAKRHLLATTSGGDYEDSEDGFDRQDGKGHSNHGTSLESLSSLAIWLLLLTPYVMLGVALMLDLNPDLRLTRTTFTGNVSECVASEMDTVQPCVHVVNENFSTLHSAPILVPLQSSFLNLDVLYTGNLSTAGFPGRFNGDDLSNLDETPVLVGARLEVPLDDGSGWETLYSGEMRDLSASCDLMTGTCLGMRLLSILFDTPGMRRGFPTYRIALTLAGPQAALALNQLSCDVEHDRYTFLLVMAAFRAVLLIATLTGAYLWLTSMLKELPRVCDWLPEQQQVAFIFPTLVLWQDPISLALFWLQQPKPALLFSADLIHAVGYQVLLLLWWIIMDGLACYEASRDSWARAIGNQSAGMPLPPPWPPKHHPMGDFFLDFLIPKLAFFSISFVSVFVLCSVRYPELFLAPNDTGAHLSTLRVVYAILSLVSLFLMLLWYCIFARAVLATGRSLRRQPYMQIRSQQLSYRFFVQQLVLILVCKGAGYVVEGVRLFELLRSHLGQLQLLWHTELSLDSFQLPYWVSSFRSTPGELLFISVCCYLAAFIFLPAKRWTESDVGGGAYPHACMESELAELEAKRRRNRSAFPLHITPPPVFCLETACWLMEAAWQSYYDPAGRLHKIDEESTSGRMALENLNLHMEGYISDADTDTHAVLARGRLRLVLSFRGTLSSKNMLTDLKMTQQPLPNLALRRRPCKLSRHGSNGSSNVHNLGTPSPSHVGRGSLSHSSLSGGAINSSSQGDDSEGPSPLGEELDELRGSVSNLCRSCLERIPGFRQALPRVHAGFLHAYLSVRSEMFATVKQALDHQYAPLYLTGHSLGGALAQLAAYDLSVNFDLPDPVQVYTFGCPRIGNVAFSTMYDMRVPATFRVVVDGDIISAWPKLFGVYRHGGVEVLVDAESGGNLIVKPSVVESMLRLRNRTSATNHSLTAYRECMEACFSSSDLLEYLLKVNGKENRTSADEELPAWLVGSRKQDLFVA